jgi:hypothetical protein
LRTSRRRRSLTAGLAAGTAGVVMAGLGLTTAPTASADVTSSYLLPQTNVFKADGTENLYTSDPFVMRCQDRDYTHGYCLYTSQDLGVVSGTGNSFQMHDTLGFFSTTGRPGTWQARGKVFDEDRIPWVPADANHQWAPGAFQTVGKGGNYTALLIPNVTNPSTPDPNNPYGPNFRTSSKIALMESQGDPFSGFQYTAQLSVVQNGSVVDGGYMSDPEVFFDDAGIGQRYIVYADGDGTTCGGLKMGVLGGSTVFDPAELVITGWPTDASTGTQLEWATCKRQYPFDKDVNGTPIPTLSRPYLEGASLYKFASWSPSLTGLPGPYTLVFPAKPLDTKVPPECAYIPRGEPGTDLSVIAWATSSTATGPYTYRGILMCGSSTEWTNQASIIDMTTNAGSPRLVLIYHDGERSNTARRRIHAECLYYYQGPTAGAGKFLVTKRTNNGFAECMSDTNPYTSGLAPKQFFLGGNADVRRIVSARDNGGGPVTATQFEVSEYERLTFIDLGNNQVAVKFGVNGGRYLSASTNGGTPGTDPMIADRTAIGAWETFTKISNSDGSISLKASVNGKFVQVGTSGQLFANLTTVSPFSWTGKFYVLHQ